MKTYLSILIIFLQFPLNLFGQDFYFISTDISNPININFQLGTYDVTTCEDSLVVDVPFFFYTDITFDDVGDLFGFSPIISSAGSNNRIHKINYVPTFYGNVLEQISDEVTALTCTSSGSVYAAGEGLTAWKTNGILTNNYLGDFPPSMQAAGDLTYRDGKLYMSTISNSLVEVDIDNPANSMVAFEFPPGTPEIHGLATVEIDCDSFITYATGINATGSTIYEVDFVNETLIEICQSDRFIVGFASMDECHIPQCDVTLDLDADDDSGTLGNNFTIGKVCVLPINITDEDVNIYSELDQVDSIEIRILNPNYLYQSLNLANANNISILGGGTPNLTLVNNGTATILDFENAMADIL